MNHFWSEPYKKKSQWKVDKISKTSNNPLQVIDFHSEKLANEFLETLNVYINGELKYSGK